MVSGLPEDLAALASDEVEIECNVNADGTLGQFRAFRAGDVGRAPDIFFGSGNSKIQVQDWYFSYRAPRSAEWKYLNTYKGQTLEQMKGHATQWVNSATIPGGGCAGILAAPAQAGTPPSWHICKKATGAPAKGPMRAYLRGVDGAEQTDEDGTLAGASPSAS
jgi:hypothetical protein